MDFFIRKTYAAISINNPSTALPAGQAGLDQLIGIAINVVFAVSGLLFLAMLLVGGINFITAGGDPKNAQAARSRITNALIGLVIVVAAFAIAQLLLNALGLGGFVEITQ